MRRTIYQNQALFAGPAPSTAAHSTSNIFRIHRVQDASIDTSFEDQDILEYGKAAPVEILADSATASFSFSYYMTDFENEKRLGFSIGSTTPCLAGIATKVSDNRNYFLAICPEGLDIESEANVNDWVAYSVGNGFISNYSFSAAVGNMPTVSVSIDALNAAAYTSVVGAQIPAVEDTGRKATGTFTLPTANAPSAGKPSVLRPGDLKVEFSNGDAGLFQDLSEVCVQSVDLSFDLNLDDTKCLGSRRSKSRDLTYPIAIQCNVEVNMGDLVEASLVDYLCSTPLTDISIKLYNDTCDSDGPTQDELFAQYIVKNAKITSEGFNSSIGPNSTVNLSFTAKMGGANDEDNGLFMSGVSGYSGVTPQYSA